MCTSGLQNMPISQGKRMRAACVLHSPRPAAQVYDVGWMITQFFEVLVAHAIEWGNLQLAVSLAQTCRTGNSLFESSIKSLGQKEAITNIESELRRGHICCVFNCCFSCGRPAKCVGKFNAIFRDEFIKPVIEVNSIRCCASECKMSSKLLDHSTERTCADIPEVGLCFTQGANSWEGSTVNAYWFEHAVLMSEVRAFVQSVQTYRFESPACEHRVIYDVVLSFLNSQSCLQQDVHVQLEQGDAAKAFGVEWASTKNVTKHPGNGVPVNFKRGWECVLRNMRNTKGQRGQLLHKLCQYGSGVLTKIGPTHLMGESHSLHRRKNMAVRIPTRQCTHGYANDTSLLRCSHCGWFRRGNGVKFRRGWKNKHGD